MIFITLNPQNNMVMYACVLVFVVASPRKTHCINSVLDLHIPSHYHFSLRHPSLHIPSRTRRVHEIQQIIALTPHIRLNRELIDKFGNFFRMSVCCYQYLSRETDLCVLNLRCNLRGGEEKI